METPDGSMTNASVSNCEPGARSPVDQAFEQAHRAQVANLVLACWEAVQGGYLEAWLNPIPVTRLNLAQSAFREITAVRIANILRSGVYRLARAGKSDPLSKVVADLTRSIGTATERVDHLLARFVQAGTRGAPAHREIPLQPNAVRSVAPMGPCAN